MITLLEGDLHMENRATDLLLGGLTNKGGEGFAKLVSGPYGLHHKIPTQEETLTRWTSRLF